MGTWLGLLLAGGSDFVGGGPDKQDHSHRTVEGGLDVELDRE